MPPTQVVVPTLTDGVVTLRELRDDDLDALVAQCQDPEIVRWTRVHEGYTEQDGRDFIARTAAEWASGERCGWAIEHEGWFAGLVSHRPRAEGVVELGFAAHPARRGQGLMSRAVRLVVAHAVEHGATTVLWHAIAGNFGSRKVAWRGGFRISGPVPHQSPQGLVDYWAGSWQVGDPVQPQTRWLSAPVLRADTEGRQLRLRPFRDADAQNLPTQLDEPAASYLGGSMPTRDGYPAWLLDRRSEEAAGEGVSVAITDPATDRVLGGVQVFRLASRSGAGSGTLAYWLLEDARGQGLMGSALEQVLAWAFRRADAGGLGLHRLTAECVVTNLASGRVLRRAGFTPVGTERRAVVVDDRPTDTLLFELLATDDRESARVQPGRMPVLETPHFRLRPWRHDDVPGPDEGPDAASLRFMPPSAHPDADAYRGWLEARRLRADEALGLDWCIADSESDHALGNLTIFRLGPPTGRFQAEVGYWLHPPARGRGVLREALPPVIDHAFAPVAEGGLGLTRLYAETDLDNAASQAVLLRAGFRRWGRDRKAFRNAVGELTDGAHFELLAEDERIDRRPATGPACDGRS